VFVAVPFARGKAARQLGLQGCFVVAEQQCADAVLATRHQQKAERAGADGIAQRLASASRSALCRAHRCCRLICAASA